MTVTLEDFLAEHPVDRTLIDSHKQRMMAEVRAYKLRELREASGLTQQQLATSGFRSDRFPRLNAEI